MTLVSLEELAATIAAVSPDWAGVVRAPAAAGAIASTDLPTEIRMGVEAIREGWLLHRGAPRVVDGASPDLALLIGDWCYATGLGSITEHGSLADVSTLADLVADLSSRPDAPLDELEARWTQANETHAAPRS
jgi:hypothetical protein